MLLLLAASAGELHAETTMVLATGPDQRTGIPYLSANVIPYLSTTYLDSSKTAGPTLGAGASSQGGGPPAGGIQVLYTGRKIVPDGGWPRAGCGAYSLLTVREKPLVYFFESGSGWSLFLAFPAGYDTPCAFVSIFINRFEYFLGITQNTALSSFPAVLNLP